MRSLSRQRTRPEASYEVATVAAVAGSAITVRTSWAEFVADRAASCLVAPEPGDEVAVVTTPDDRAFVIAVLVRPDSDAKRPTEIAVEGDLRITAGGTMSLASKVLNVHAVEGSFVLSKLTVLASSVLGHSESVRIAAKVLESFCERVSQTAKTWNRKVEELDMLRAGHIDYVTDHEMCLRSENFLVGARDLAKLDAEQIHIG